MKISELSNKKTILVKAAKGCVLPLIHDGKKVRITEKEAVTLEADKLSYESKVILCDAFKLNQVEEEKTKGAK